MTKRQKIIASIFQDIDNERVEHNREWRRNYGRKMGYKSQREWAKKNRQVGRENVRRYSRKYIKQKLIFQEKKECPTCHVIGRHYLHTKLNIRTGHQSQYDIFLHYEGNKTIWHRAKSGKVL